jgi:molecular chaperone HscB
MNFTQNYFEILDVPQQYTVDKMQLPEHYRGLLKQFHPDNFSTQSVNEQRLAVQFSAYINTAYQTLMSPVLRAEYLLLLANEPVDHQSTTISDSQFLMRQMEWREALADTRELADLSLAENQLDDLRQEVKKIADALEQSFNDSYTQGHFSLAKDVVAKLHFVNKMLAEIDSIESSLFD